MKRSAPLLFAILVALVACDPAEPTPRDDDAGVPPRGDAAPPSGDASVPDAGRADSGVPEPDCAATDGARCLYVAVDGDDEADGSLEAPLQTFQAAIGRAQPGDFIYARGGTYGLENAAIARLQRLPRATFSPPCAGDQVEADGYCQVPYRAFAAIGDWNGYPLPDHDGHESPSGEPGRPITLRNFPGELPVLDMRLLERDAAIEDALVQSQRYAIAIQKSHWVIRGFEVIGGSVNLSGNIEDITIEGCDVHDVTRDGGDNPGLIRLNRGPEDVRILNNRLHGIYDHEQPGEWRSVPDAQHFGAVTTLSGETYGGMDDTGAVEIRGNVIFEVPQVFFFKNAARGPIEIVDNEIYDSGRLASIVTSNVRLAGNLVHGVPSGIWRHGQGFTELGDSNPEVLALDGHMLTLEYNTFVGLEGTMLSSGHGEGRVLRHNVVFGLPSVAATADWDSGAWLKLREDVPPGESKLLRYESDDNCFVVPDAGFQYAARYPSEGRVQHHDLAEGRSLFGLESRSVVVVSADPASVFVDPDAGDYALRSGHACGADSGHTAFRE